jgi:hypothetical protein
LRSNGPGTSTRTSSETATINPFVARERRYPP